MSMWNRSGRTNTVLFTVTALVAGGAATLPLLGSAELEPRASVDRAVLERAMSSAVPARRTMTDEIEHFQARAAARPDEAFSKERLVRAHLLAFRAYGQVEHLDRAAAVANAMTAPSGSGSERESPSALRSLSSLRLAEHDFQGALESARSIAELSGRDAARFRLFDALWAVGSKQEAAALLDEPLDTLSTDYLARRARVIDGAGFTELARDLFRRVEENARAFAEPAPVRAWALVELGHFELHSGDPALAVRRYLEALEVLPGSPAALEGLASVAYRVDRDLETARALYSRALENGAHLEVMPTLADIEEALGRGDEALRLRRSFVRRATADPRAEAMHRRPLVFLLAEEPETRAEAIRQARLDLGARRDQGAFDALAWALFRDGEVEMAWLLAERALAAGGPPPPVLFRAGLIAEAAGEPERARDLLQEALVGNVELAPHEIASAREVLDRS
jgi:tetratricopeptide (TPR) repeat protein